MASSIVRSKKSSTATIFLQPISFAIRDASRSAALRIRYFADFAKLERLAVAVKAAETSAWRARWWRLRSNSAGKKLPRSVHPRAKAVRQFLGTARVYAHAERPRIRRFSDYDYVEVKLETEKHPQSITLGDDPYVLIRPEGQWEVLASLELSAGRGTSISPSGRLVTMSSVIDLRTYVGASKKRRLLVNDRPAAGKTMTNWRRTARRTSRSPWENACPRSSMREIWGFLSRSRDREAIPD